MSKDYIPATDDGLRSWAENFSEKITANPTSYGLDAAIAAEYAATVDEYVTALAAAQNPETRGGSTIFAKETVRGELVSKSRQIGQQVTRTITVTDQQRYDLGLTVRDDEPTSVPPPNQGPLMVLKGVTGRTVRVRLKDITGERRGKPAGVAGATILSYVGESQPESASQWQFQGSTSRTTVNVEFPVTVPAGSKVWVSAFWFNSKLESGPIAPLPVQTYLQIGNPEEGVA
jgi:hypothetical protein